ncbi:MAG: toprim domain-containing protein [Xanthobacteraceae bacterium]
MSNSLRSIAHALGGDIAGRNRILCPGPGHSRRDRSLSVTFNGDDFLCHSFAGDDWRECKDYVKAALGWTDAPRHVNDNHPPAIDTAALLDEQRRIRSSLRRWATAVPIAGTLAERYLASRGLSYDGDAIRYRANDRTMVALMTDIVTAEPTGVHVTYIDPEGRKLGRKMYGRARGAVVRLSDDADVHYGLAIAEGIETALATNFAPMWACLSAGTVAAFPVLGAIAALTIFADNDRSGTGIRAAKACAERWHAAGREAIIHIPTETGVDFATFVEAA